MKIKVCGMKYPGNIREVAGLNPDLIGFIFYPPSPRCVEPANIRQVLDTLEGVAKVGVFVDHPPEAVIRISRELSLDYAQLHGAEDPETGDAVKAAGIRVIKVFKVHDQFDWHTTRLHHDRANLFLFDTAGRQPGGTGVKFNWKVLSGYTGTTPFLLSGGIGPEDAAAIKQISHPQLWGVDVNSRMEDRPGEKNTLRIQGFIKEIRNEK